MPDASPQRKPTAVPETSPPSDRTGKSEVSSVSLKRNKFPERNEEKLQGLTSVAVTEPQGEAGDSGRWRREKKASSSGETKRLLRKDVA